MATKDTGSQAARAVPPPFGNWGQEQTEAAMALQRALLESCDQASRAWRKLSDRLEASFAQVKDVPVVGFSALSGRGVERLMPKVFETYDIWNKRVPTPRLNRWLREMETLHPPPLARGRRIRLRFMTQIKRRPPTFVLSVSQPEELGDDYLRFLINRLRDDFAGGKIAGKTHLARRAKHAAHRAADLRAHARGHAARETHQHRFDARIVREREEIFAREAVARIRLERGRQHADARLGGEPRADFRRQLRHRVDGKRIGELEVEIVPELLRVHRRKFPARKQRAQLGACEVVEIDAGSGGHGTGD